MKNKGLSLIEILVAGSILAGMSVVLMKFFQSGTQAQKNILQQGEINSLTNEMRAFLAIGDVCTKNFKDQILTEVASRDDLVPHVRSNGILINELLQNDAASTMRYCSLASCPNRRFAGVIQINTMKLGGFVLWNSAPVAAGVLRKGLALLLVSYKKLGHAEQMTLSTEFIDREIGIVVAMDGDKIVECTADSAGSDSIWQLNAQGIHYNSGAVGIGTSLPNGDGGRAAGVLQIHSDTAQSAIHITGGQADPNTNAVLNICGPDPLVSDCGIWRERER